jgi:uncharacterized protein YgfB (UPF0149 family)
MTQTSLPGYTDVNTALANTHSAFQAADAHGLLCGIICATTGSADNWEKLILGPIHNPQSTEVLLELYEASYHQMSEFSFEFSLLLPGDNEEINSRTEALGLWCQGFLTGLSQSEAPVEEHNSPDVIETLNDIIEIAQVSYGDIGNTDEDESAYFELLEYVRLAALMLFHELKSPPTQQVDGEESDEFDRDADNNDGFLH